MSEQSRSVTQISTPPGERTFIRVSESSTITVELRSGSSVTFQIPEGGRFAVTNWGDVSDIHFNEPDDFLDSENGALQ
jgi:hypothetical protein